MQQAQVLNQALDRIYAARPDIGTMRRVAVQKPRFVEGSVSMGGTHVRLVDGDGKGHMLTAQEALEAVRRREMRRAG